MKFWIAVLAILILAVALRAWHLDIRPMHCDEAVHAYKFGQLLERNDYRYDPQEFHGPTLNYFTLIPAWLAGQSTYISVTENTLRIVPVFFGVLLVVLTMFFAGGLGKPASLVAAAITAISPAFVFYSRYYIQEILLVCFTFGLILAGYKYARSGRAVWALLAGVFAGLCCATKETCVIAFGAMLIALLLVRLRGTASAMGASGKIKIAHLVMAVVLVFFTSGLFFSSFFTNAPGLMDSFKAYATYFDRAGLSQHHVHPWYYYLQTLIYTKSSSGPPWTEASVVILAVVGLILIITRKGLGKLDLRLLDFIVLYTIILLVIYSAIPYKTPWCLLSFYHGMILLAGVGVVAMLNLLGRTSVRIIVALFLLTAATDLGLQAFTASTISYADIKNPYAYVQPTDDVIKIAERVEQVSRASPAGHKMPVYFVCPEGDYWPMPWYLRSFENVGWFDDVNQITSPAPVIIAAPVFENRLINRLFDISLPGQKNLYVPLFDNYIELRPGVELRGYVTKDLADQSRQLNADR